MWDVWVVDLVTGETFLGWSSLCPRRAARLFGRWRDRDSRLVLVAAGSGSNFG